MVAGKKLEPKEELGFLFPFLFILFVFLVFRNIGQYPAIFADEFSYSKYSRLHPLSESIVPNWLYLKVFSYTNHCGDGFLECARVVNSLLFVIAGSFIYLTTRLVAARSVAFFVTFLALLGPINTYTAYFMPEAFYFFVFWLLCWFLLRINFDSNSYEWTFPGVAYGLLSCVKPHAVYFFPAVFLYIIYVFYLAGKSFSKRNFYALAFFTLSALTTKLLVGYLLAGKAGLTIFGRLYGEIGSSFFSADLEKYIRTIWSAMFNVWGHLSVLSLIYGIPVLASVATLFFLNDRPGFIKKGNKDKIINLKKAACLALAVVLNLMTVVALFTAYAAHPASLHLRYYNFALPLFYIVAAGAISLKGFIFERRKLYYILAAALIILASYAVLTNLVAYSPLFIDGPEISGLHVNSTVFRVVGGVLLGVLILYAFLNKLGLKAYFFLVLPLFCSVSYFNVVDSISHLKVENIYSKAGILAREYLSMEERSKLVVLAHYDGGAMHTLFFVDAPGITSHAQESYRAVDPDKKIDVFDIPSNKDWILAVGKYKLPDGDYYAFQKDFISLARISWSDVIDFRDDAKPIIFKAQGLSARESWGSWSNSEVVSIKFARSLPESFRLHFTAFSFGPNTEELFTVAAGSTIHKLNVESSAKMYTLDFSNPDRGNEIKFIVPKPVSPKDLMMGSDDRKLGLGLVEMQVVPLEP